MKTLLWHSKQYHVILKYSYNIIHTSDFAEHHWLYNVKDVVSPLKSRQTCISPFSTSMSLYCIGCILSVQLMLTEVSHDIWRYSWGVTHRFHVSKVKRAFKTPVFVTDQYDFQYYITCFTNRLLYDTATDWKWSMLKWCVIVIRNIISYVTKIEIIYDII